MTSAYSAIVALCIYRLIVALIAKVKHLSYLKICKKKLGPNLNHLQKNCYATIKLQCRLGMPCAGARLR